MRSLIESWEESYVVARQAALDAGRAVEETEGSDSAAIALGYYGTLQAAILVGSELARISDQLDGIQLAIRDQTEAIRQSAGILATEIREAAGRG